MPSGTSWKGPLLGDWRAAGGAFYGVGQGAASEFESDYVVMHENFADEVANTAQMELLGWTETAVGAGTGRTHTVTREDQGTLVILAGTADDVGSNLQHNAAMSETRTSPCHKTIGAHTYTTATHDNTTIILATRVGWSVESTGWDAKMVFGWVMTDTGLMAATTGVLSGIGTGGGVGFHYAENGNIYYFTQRTTYAANFAEVDTGYDVDDPTQTFTLNTVGKSNWIGLAIRLNYIDGSDDDNNGWCDFYMNPSDTPGAWVHVGSVANNNPYTSGVEYSPTIEVIRGEVNDSDTIFGFNGIYSAITKYGRERSAPAV